MSIRMKQIEDFFKKLYPENLAEDYDNVGLIVGDNGKEINKILVTLDMTTDVINEAVDKQIDLIISHHPLIFKPLKKINCTNWISELVYKLIRNNINLYVLHTNYDVAPNGMNDVIAKKLNLNKIEVLSDDKNVNLYKLVVYVPATHENEVRKVLFDCGAGHIGNYDSCSFNTKGIGTFRPLDGSHPFIGEINKQEYVEEIKIETIITQENLNTVIAKMLQVHPYEEPAYDVIKLENKINRGIGRIGELDKPIMLNEFAVNVKKIFNLDNVTVIGENKLIKKVAIVGGAGSEFINIAKKKKCDLIITGDVKHHIAIDALENDISVIDATHYGLEQVFIDDIKNILENEFKSIEVIRYFNKQPFNII